jgi:hypothetical protein
VEVTEFFLDAVEFGDDDWGIKRIRSRHRGSVGIFAERSSW